MLFKERPTHVGVEAVGEMVRQVAETSFEDLGAVAERRIWRERLRRSKKTITPVFRDAPARFTCRKEVSSRAEIQNVQQPGKRRRLLVAQANVLAAIGVTVLAATVERKKAG